MKRPGGIMVLTQRVAVPVIALLGVVVAMGCGDDGPKIDVIAPPPPNEQLPPTPPPDSDFYLLEVVPDVGATVGLDEVELRGKGLANAAAVHFGEVEAAEFFVVSDALIVALTPARPGGGLVDVVITLADGDKTALPLGYNYRDTVLVTGAEPNAGNLRGGDAVTLFGDGFDATSAVVIGGRTAPVVEFVDATTLQIVTPEGVDVGRSELYVTSAGGVAQLDGGFTYYTDPAIALVTPAAGPRAGGIRVDVLGQGFASPMSVAVDGRPLSELVVVGADQVTGIVAAGGAVGPADVVVTTPWGTALAADAFTYFEPAAEPFALVSVFPRAGSLAGGELITLTVLGLGEDAPGVRFGNREAEVVSWDSDARSVLVRAPSTTAATSVAVKINQSGNASAIEGAYTYRDLPAIDTVSPSSGPAAGGTRVTIRGTGFAPGSAVRIGPLAATNVNRINSTTLEATTPLGSPGAASVRVISAGVETVLPSAFEYEAAPAVFLVDPPTGAQAGGSRVSIIGHGFSVGSGVSVTFGGATASNIQVVSSTEIQVTTPAGPLGPVDVKVSGSPGAGIDATLVNGFAYFDPATAPGTWGGPVSGTLNVTVIERRSGARVANAAVLVGEDTAGLRGVTNDSGQVTFSDPSLVGEQVVTVSVVGTSAAQIAGFDATNVTVAVDALPACSDIPSDTPCDGLGEPPPTATFRGTILGYNKGPTIPWGQCADHDGREDGLCEACVVDADCLSGVCGEIPGQGWFCTQACDITATAAPVDEPADVASGEPGGACPDTFTCVDVTGGPQSKCLPPAPEIRVFCDFTNGALFDDDELVYPGVLADEESKTFELTTRLGNYAVYCWRGGWVNGQFRADMLGVVRGLGAFSEGEVVEAEIRLDIPLSKKVDIEIDRAAMGGNPETSLRTVMDLGGDGVLEFPQLRAFRAKNFTLNLPATLSGDLYDAHYDFFVNIEVPELSGSSSTIERNITRIDNNIDYRLGAGGWEPQNSVVGTTYGIATQAGEAIAVGDSGRILRSVTNGYWATQPSNTTADLFAVAALDGDATEASAVATGARGTAVHWDGLVWTSIPTGTVVDLVGVALRSDGIAYAVGSGEVHRYEPGSGWSLASETSAELRAVGVLEDGRVLVVGAGGALVSGDDGATWSAVAGTEASTLNAVHIDATGAWLVGEAGTVLRFESAGSTAFRVDTPTDVALHAVWGNGPDTLWVAGSRATILRWDGASWWTETPTATRGTLRALGGGGDDIWAMGSHELVLGPMLSIPENLEPTDGGQMTDRRLRWTLRPSAEAHYTTVAFGSAVGPCSICGLMFSLPFEEWGTILNGDRTEAVFPRIRELPFGQGFVSGSKLATITRVRLEGDFDFNDTAGSGLFGGNWRSWSTREIFVGVP